MRILSVNPRNSIALVATLVDSVHRVNLYKSSTNNSALQASISSHKHSQTCLITFHRHKHVQCDQRLPQRLLGRITRVRLQQIDINDPNSSQCLVVHLFVYSSVHMFVHTFVSSNIRQFGRSSGCLAVRTLRWLDRCLAV